MDRNTVIADSPAPLLTRAKTVPITTFLMFVLSGALLPTTGMSQSIILTLEQQQMLNQLSPEQRQEAIEALQQRRGGHIQSVGQPVREAADQGPGIDPELLADLPRLDQLRAGPNSRLIIDLTLKSSLTAEETADFAADAAVSRLRGSNTYILDDIGVLSLLGIESIPLLGLTENDIQRRLAAESLLAPFDIGVRILETESTGVDALRPFGYDILEPRHASFDPPTTGPVPPDYVLGSGDSVRVQFFGNVNGVYDVDVTRDGVVNLPEIGPVTVAGMRFSEFRTDIGHRVKEMLIGTQVSVSMGQLRTIRVFVLGDANLPGSYVVSSLATISSALYRSGGVSRIGSLRNIELKRGGKTVARLDLYDLFLQGDTSNDKRLQPGDVIFIPPVTTQVSVSGAVNRPAIYETRGDASVSDVVRLAGGMLAEAFPDGARIERISDNERRIVVSIDADSQAAANTPVRPGDVLTIPRVLAGLENTVSLVGHVHRPGPYQWRSGMRLSDLVSSVLELKPGADTNYLLIRREDPDTRRVFAKSANLTSALSSPGSTDNELLQPRDTVHVFSLAFGRQRVIEPILDELELQAEFGDPHEEVSVSGRVKAPGSYPLEPGMRVSDLVRAGGNLAEQAYTLNAELARYEVIGGEYRSADVITVDLQAILRGDQSADLLLAEHDNLRISSVPQWDLLWSVELDGEVRFPGTYRIRRGETLREVLERAGGLSDEAFPEGAVFLRDSLRQREQEQIETLVRRLEADLTSKSLESPDVSGAQAMETGRSILSQLRETTAVGRLVIDLDQLASRTDNELVSDVELRDGDRLLVPKQAQEVTVIGETQQNTSHLFQPGLSRKDYIEMSGGLTRRADKGLIYVVRASGSVVASNRSRWLGRSAGVEIRPGDTIVVPLDTDPIRPLTVWASVTQILYQAAIAVAAVNSFK